MHRLLESYKEWWHDRLTTPNLFREVGRFYKRHWVATLFSGIALTVAIIALIIGQNQPPNDPNAVYGHNPSAVYNPNRALEGGGFSPTPNDVFAPPDSNAETYPGFPPGTRFLPGLVRDRLSVVSEGIALRFWARYRLTPNCGDGHSHIHLHRYVDPEKQTLARSTVGGCDIFIDIHTKIPRYSKSWNAMGYCNLIVHESGHSVGLLHSGNPSDIMYYFGNSRARTGCERFAPANYGTYQLTRIPIPVVCTGKRATRDWLSGNYAKALDRVTKAGTPETCWFKG